MTTLRQLNSQDPGSANSVQMWASSLLSMDQIRDRYENFEAQMTELGLLEDSSREYEKTLEGVRKTYGDPGLNDAQIFEEMDRANIRGMKQWKTRAGMVAQNLRPQYLELLQYQEDLWNERSQYQDYFLRMTSMSAILRDASEMAESPEEKRRYDTLENEIMQYAVDRIYTGNVNNTRLCNTAVNRFLCYGFSDDGESMSEDSIYGEINEVRCLAIDMQKKGYHFENTENMAHEMISALKEIPQHMVMFLDAPDQKTAKLFFDHEDRTTAMPSMTLAERDFAVHNFDDFFHQIYPDSVTATMRTRGEDIFDHIFVDGESLTDRYGELCRNQSYYYASEEMKCQLISEMINGKRITCVTEDKNGRHLIPVTMSNRIPGMSDLLPDPPLYSAAEESTRINDSLNALKSRSADEINRKHARLLNNRPYYERMDAVEHGPYQSEILGKTKAMNQDDRNRRYSQIYQMYDHLSILADPSNGPSSPELSFMLDFGEELASRSFLGAGVTKATIESHPIYQDMGIQSISDLIYVDGKPINDFLGEMPEFAARGGLSGDAYIKAAAAALITSGKHHVDVVRIGNDEYGNFDISVSEFQADLHFLDGQEGLLHRSRAHHAQKLYEEDPSARQKSIKDQFSLRLAEKVTKALNARTNPYSIENERFQNHGTKLTGDYFDEQSRDALSASISEFSELNRGAAEEFGGCVRLAQLSLLDSHPEIRYADLMNPDLFQQEKRAAGKMVAQEFENYRLDKEHKAWEKQYARDPAGAGPEPPKPDFRNLANLGVLAITAMGKLNLRKELCYALGQPDNIGNQELRDLLKNPEQSVAANAFFSSIAGFAQSSYQAINDLDPENHPVSFRTVRDNTYPVHHAIMTTAGKDIVEKYNRSVISMAKMLQYEKKIMQTVGGGFALYPDDIGINRMMAEYTRDWIINGGKPSEVTDTELVHMNQCTYDLSAAMEMSDVTIKEEDLNSILYENKLPGELKYFADTVPYMMAVEKAEDHFKDLFRDYKALDQADYNMLENNSKIGQFGRLATRVSMARGLAMTKGESLTDILNASADKKSGYGRDMVQFLCGHPVALMESGSDKIDVVVEVADFYQKWNHALMNEKMPSYDYRNVREAVNHAEHVTALRCMTIDFDQCQSDLHKIPAYNAMMKPDIEAKGLNAMNAAGVFLNAMSRINSKNASLMERACSALILDEFSDEIKGKTMEEIGAAFDADGLSMFQSVVQFQLNEVPKDQLISYLNHEIPCPVDAKEIEKTMEIRKKQPEPVALKAQDDMEAGRKKVGLGNLLDEEPEKEVLRRQRSQSAPVRVKSDLTKKP